MAYAIIASTIAASTAGAAITTSAINTTGANLIVLHAAWSNVNVTDINITDSKGNTWTPLTKQTVISGNNASVQLWYAESPTVGTGHTFTAGALQPTTFANIGVIAASGSVASAFDQENGATATSASTIQAGSVTPAEDNELIIAALQTSSVQPISINGGLTALTVILDSGDHVGGGIAYLIQTSAVAVNPTWDVTSSTAQLAATIATFKGTAPVTGTMEWFSQPPDPSDGPLVPMSYR